MPTNREEQCLKFNSMRRNLYIALIPIMLLLACGEKPKSEKLSQTMVDGHAKRFSLVQKNGITELYLFGIKNKPDTTSRFILAKDTVGLANTHRGFTVIKTPVKKVAALGSVYANMLDVLGALDCLVAVDNMQYIGNPRICAKHQKSPMAELALSPVLDFEKTWRLQPDILFTFGMGEGEKDVDQKIKMSRLPNCVIVDHLESNPLARAEWIKVVAVFLDKDSLANAIFDATVERYNKLKARAASDKNRPTVFTEARFGDVWYMPGGKSFMACLIKDAGAQYLWADDQSTGSIPLSFEQVYAKAKGADFWINPSAFKNKDEMQQAENRYTSFAAFQNNTIYNNNLHLNQYGYSNYWESGLIFPDRIISDLIKIFHPALKISSDSSFNYYKRLN